MAKNWSTLFPFLKSQGYCVFALNYGETNGVYATARVADSAKELAPFVDAVGAATGPKKVDPVGHSQGGMMPRYYMGLLGGAKNVHHLVGIAPLQPRHNDSQFLSGPARQVTNITIQDKCPADVFEHDQTLNDPVVHQFVARALGQATGPADPAYQPSCL